MRPPIYPNPKRLIVITISFASLLSSCARGPWLPVNVGRENGNPTVPFVVSHLPKKNRWAMDRTSSHSIFRQVLCFNYACCRMIGRRKALGAISYKQFVKEIKKNAKKGYYEHMTPTVPAPPAIKKQNPDTLVIAKDTARITKNKPKVLPAPILKADSLITLSEFLFEFDSYTLKDKHYSQLDSLSKFILAHPSIEVRITGHTDNRGTERHNENLSMRRAEAVALYLINKGIPDEKIFFEGLGSSKPIQGNDTEEGRSKNRRVEILMSNTKRK